MTTSQHPMLAVLRYPLPRAYLISNFVSIIGSWCQRVAIYWYIWEHTRSLGYLSLITLFDAGPAIVLSPVAGALADRLSMRTVVFLGRTAGAVQALPVFFLIS